MPASSQRTCAPPEEELFVDRRFYESDEEVVGYESVDELVRLDAGEVGDNDGRGVNRNPLGPWPSQKYVWAVTTGLSRVYGEGPRKTGCSTASQ